MPNSKDIAPRDENRNPTLIGVSSVTTTINGIVFTQDETPVPIAVNPATGAVKVEVA